MVVDLSRSQADLHRARPVGPGKYAWGRSYAQVGAVAVVQPVLVSLGDPGVAAGAWYGGHGRVVCHVCHGRVGWWGG